MADGEAAPVAVGDLLHVVVPPSLDQHEDVQGGIPFFLRDVRVEIIIRAVDPAFQFAAQAEIGRDAVAGLPVLEGASHYGN